MNITRLARFYKKKIFSSFTANHAIAVNDFFRKITLLFPDGLLFLLLGRVALFFRFQHTCTFAAA